MARIQYSGLVTGMKGKLGGSVLSGGKAGNIIRQNLSWGRNNSSRWFAVRARHGSLAGEWRGLTAAQRTQWEAAAVNFPFTDKFGSPYVASGFQVFMSLNRSRMEIGLAFLTTPPAPVGLFDIGATTLSDATGANLTVSWTNALTAAETVQVFACPPQSAGKAFRPGSLKLLKYVSGVGTTTLDFGTEYLTAYGSEPSGSLIWCKTQTVTSATGEHGLPYTASFAVP